MRKRALELRSRALIPHFFWPGDFGKNVLFSQKVWQSSEKDTLARSKEVRNLTLSIGVMVAAIARLGEVKV